MDSTYALVTQENERLHAPIQKGQTFNCLFTRRTPKGKNAKPHFYFYTEDQEDLIISASYKSKKGTTFKMSLNSKEIKRKSLWFAGLCSDAQTKKVFIGSYPNKPGSMAYSIKIDCNEENAQITLPPLNSENFTFNEGQSQENGFLLISNITDNTGNGEDADYCTVNVFLSDSPVLVLHQFAEDEIEVKISYPLTIFQAFCIACVLTN